MYAIVDKRTPQDAKANLAKYVDDLFEFSSNHITYNAISGHPDIFMFQDSKTLIVAPNSPKDLLSFLDEKQVEYTFGTTPVGETLNESVPYNCLASNTYFFCKKGKPDTSIQNHCATKKLVNLPQSYTRCNMFCIGDNRIITSDMGIVKAMKNNVMDAFYFDPKQIKITDHKYGFIGGTMGRMDNKIFFLGDILMHKDGKRLYEHINSVDKEVVCLGKDYLYDGGGIFFVD